MGSFEYGIHVQMQQRLFFDIIYAFGGSQSWAALIG